MVLNGRADPQALAGAWRTMGRDGRDGHGALNEKPGPLEGPGFSLEAIWDFFQVSKVGYICPQKFRFVKINLPADLCEGKRIGRMALEGHEANGSWGGRGGPGEQNKIKKPLCSLSEQSGS